MKPVAVAVFRPRLATCAFVLVRCLQYWFLVLFFREKKKAKKQRESAVVTLGDGRPVTVQPSAVTSTLF